MMKRKIISLLLILSIIAMLLSDIAIAVGTETVPDCSCGNKIESLTIHADGCARKAYCREISVKSAKELFDMWGKLPMDVRDFVLTYLSWTNWQKLQELNELLKDFKEEEEPDEPDEPIEPGQESCTCDEKHSYGSISHGSDCPYHFANISIEDEYIVYITMTSDMQSTALSLLGDAKRAELEAYIAERPFVNTVLEDGTSITAVDVPAESTLTATPADAEFTEGNILPSITIADTVDFSLDIKVYDRDGNPYQSKPGETVMVKVSDPSAVKGDGMTFLHILDTPSAIQKGLADGTIKLLDISHLIKGGSDESEEESSEDVSEESSEEVSEETSEEVSEETSEEVSEEFSDEVSEESSEEVSEESSDEVSEESSEDVSEESSEEVSEETSEEVSEETSKEVSEETSEEVSEETSEEVSEETSEEVSEESTEEVSEESSEEVSEESSEEVSEESSEEVSEESSEEVSEESSEEVSEETSEEVSEETSEEVSEEETGNPYGLPAEYVAALEATAELGYENQIAYEFISGTCMDDGYYTFYTDSFSAFSPATLNENKTYTISTDTTNGQTAQSIDDPVTVTATNATLQFKVQGGGAVVCNKSITINSERKLTVKFHSAAWDISSTMNRGSGFTGAFFINNGTLIINGGTTNYPNTKFTLDGKSISASAPAIINNGTLTLNKVNIKNNLNKATNSTGGGLYLSNGSGATNTLTNVTITNCTASQAGGGIQHQSKNALNMTSVTIQNCSACHGTAIMIPGNNYNNWGALTASNCKFINNDYTSGSGGVGGAIRTNGNTFCNAKFTNCEFYNNDSCGYGGAFYWNAGKKSDNAFCKLTIENCLIHNNSAKESGGAIYCEAFMEIKGNTEIYENRASKGGGGVGVRSYNNELNTGLGGTSLILSPGIKIYNNTSDTDGGGIWMYAKNSDSMIDTATFNLQLNGAQVYNNNAVINGGGIYMKRDETGNNYKCTVLLDYGKLENNVSGSDGGGVYTENLDVTIGNNVGNELLITGNTAVHEGGAVYATGTGVVCDIINGTITSNKAEAKTGDAAHGGAIACFNGHVNVSGGTLSGNSATTNGGAIYVEGSESTFKITNGTITENTAQFGGGIYCSLGQVTVEGGTLSKNSTIGVGEFSHGGAIYVKGDGSAFKITDGTITENTAKYGGGIECEAGSTVTVNGGTFTANKATEHGGAVYVTGKGSLFVSNGVFTGNDAKNGAAIGCVNSTATVDGGNFQNNTATANGGAVYVNGYNSSSKLTLTNGSFTQNSANYGGAIACLDNNDNNTTNTTCEVTLSGGNFQNNTATANGGAVSVSGFESTFEITGGTITNNNAKNGGALACNPGHITVKGGDLKDNTATENGGAIYVKGASSTFSIEGGALTANNAVNGGALACEDGTVTVNGGNLDENSATAFGGAVYSTGASATVHIGGNGSISSNTAANGGGIYATSGSEINVTGGLIRYNSAKGIPDATTTGYNDAATSGVGGGIYVGTGTNSAESSITISGTSIGLYGNNADFAANDAFASGVNTSVSIPSVAAMTLKDYEGRPTGWFEDYATGDTEYSKGLKNGTEAVRYADARNAQDVGVISSNAKYIALTLGTQKLGYGNLTIVKTGTNIDPNQVFIFKVTGTAVDDTSIGPIYVSVQGAGSTTINTLPDGDYTIEEITSWSWRYKPAESTKTQKVGEDNAAVEFENTLSKNNWLSASHNVTNVYNNASAIDEVQE